MAKQRYGINDAYRGTVGTVIGYQWRGRWCLRARPRQVRNPRTAGQRAARGLFSLVSQLASHFAPVLRIGLHGEAVKAHRTECNHFMSVNNPCFTLEGGRLAVDYEGLVIAQGPVAPVGFGVPTAAEGRTVVVPFEKNPQHLRADGDDQVYLYAWCAALDEGVLSVPSCRRCRRAEITLPAHWAGNEVYLYGFVKDYAGRASDSVCLGVLRMEYEERMPSESSLHIESQDAIAADSAFAVLTPSSPLRFGQVSELPCCSAFAVLLAKQVVDGLHGVEGGHGDLDEEGDPVGHGAVP